MGKYRSSEIGPSFSEEYSLDESKDILSPAEVAEKKTAALEEIETKIQSLKRANLKLQNAAIEDEITILEQTLENEKTTFDREVGDYLVYLKKYRDLQSSKKKLIKDLLETIRVLSNEALKNENRLLKKIKHIGISGFNKQFQGYAQIDKYKKLQFTNEDLEKLDDYSLEEIKKIMEDLLHTSNSTAYLSMVRTNETFDQLKESLDKNKCTVQFQRGTGTVELKFSEELLCQEESELSEKKHFDMSKIQVMNFDIKQVEKQMNEAEQKQRMEELHKQNKELLQLKRDKENEKTNKAKEDKFFGSLIGAISDDKYWRDQCRQFPLSTRVPTGIAAMRKIVHEYNVNDENWLSSDHSRQEFIEKLKKVAEGRLKNPRVGCFSCFSFFTPTRTEKTAEFYKLLKEKDLDNMIDATSRSLSSKYDHKP